MGDDGSDSGDLSLSCSVSSFESKESEVSELEDDLATIEPYQFEMLASSDSSSESDTEPEHDDSGDKDRLHNTDW